VARRKATQALSEYLGFRNVYGYKLDMEHIERLLERYPQIGQNFEADLWAFWR